MMRIKIILLLFVVSLGCAIPLSAQEQGEDEALFCLTIPAYKIYTHPKGFVFTYRRNSTEIGRLFFPYGWFEKKPGINAEAAKAVPIVLSAGDVSWPRVSIFYRNGQFSYIKLYTRKSLGHESWGALTSGNNFDAEFENAEPPVLNFGDSK
jgi:hypothetical protein